MPYGKIDDDLHSHPKFQVAGPVVSWAYVRSISWSNKHGTDGFIPTATAIHILPSKRHRVIITAALIPGKSPLWEAVEGGFMIHDFFEDSRNRPAVWWEELAAKRKASGQAGNEKRWGDRGEVVAKPVANAIAKPIAKPVAKLSPVPRTPEPGVTGYVSVPNGTSSADADQLVFETWKAAAGKNGRTEFDAKRRKAVRAALKAYPLDDVLDAVQGWRFSPYHCGQNENKTIYNGLELILRDSEQIEKFRDLQRNGPSLGPTITPESLRLAQWANEPVEVTP